MHKACGHSIIFIVTKKCHDKDKSHAKGSKKIWNVTIKVPMYLLTYLITYLLTNLLTYLLIWIFNIKFWKIHGKNVFARIFLKTYSSMFFFLQFVKIFRKSYFVLWKSLVGIALRTFNLTCSLTYAKLFYEASGKLWVLNMSAKAIAMKML